MRQGDWEKGKMNCQEFELIGLGIERDAAADAAERAAAEEHTSTCSRCAALQQSWLVAKLELRALSEATRAAEAPERTELRLRQEFRTRHRTMPARRAAVIAAWALATAAVLVGAWSWKNWEKTRREEATKHKITLPDKPTQAAPGGTEASGQNLAQNNVSATLTSGDDEGEFTLLPGSVAADIEDVAIWRVRMQRGALSALGFPVNEDRAGEWIQVDLLVGNDGLPQGVRLAR
jgi:hypothetical protein